MTADEIIKLLNLKPHPEGGFYNEIFRSRETVGLASLPDRYHDEATRRTFSRESLEWQVPPDMEEKAKAYLNKSREESEAKATSEGDTSQPARKSKTQTKTQEMKAPENAWRPVDINIPGAGLLGSAALGEAPVSGTQPEAASWRSIGLNAPSPHERAWCTSIYYLITADSCSIMHKLKGDEIWHFYLGDPVEMLNLYPDGSSAVIRLGHDIVSGAKPQHVVPHDTWQGARIMDGGKYALLGCTVSPGFSAKDYAQALRSRLAFRYPEHGRLIEKLTRPD